MTFYGEDSTDDNARREFFSKLAAFVTEWKVSLIIYVGPAVGLALLTHVTEIQREERCY